LAVSDRAESGRRCEGKAFRRSASVVWVIERATV
jgi:hypothetical protein